jgi:hypothetical protein
MHAEHTNLAPADRNVNIAPVSGWRPSAGGARQRVVPVVHLKSEDPAQLRSDCVTPHAATPR